MLNHICNDALQPLDRDSPEGRPQWKFTVFAQDEGGEGLVGYADILINLRDVNDNAPVFLQSLYTANVTENGTAGTFICCIYQRNGFAYNIAQSVNWESAILRQQRIDNVLFCENLGDVRQDKDTSRKTTFCMPVMALRWVFCWLRPSSWRGRPPSDITPILYNLFNIGDFGEQLDPSHNFS